MAIILFDPNAWKQCYYYRTFARVDKVFRHLMVAQKVSVMCNSILIIQRALPQRLRMDVFKYEFDRSFLISFILVIIKRIRYKRIK